MLKWVFWLIFLSSVTVIIDSDSLIFPFCIRCSLSWKNSEGSSVSLLCRPGREWRAIAHAHAHTHHILFSCAIIACLNFVWITFRRVIIAHLHVLNDRITCIKNSFQIKSIPLWNIPFRYFWTYQLSYEFDNWLLNPEKKYWNLVECKRKHLTRFNVYFNFVHSLLNIIRRL